MFGSSYCRGSSISQHDMVADDDVDDGDDGDVVHDACVCSEIAFVAR